jgi:hypothetical protein
MLIKGDYTMTNNLQSNKLPLFILLVLISFSIAGIIFAINFNKEVGSPEQQLLLKTNVLDKAFDDGVNCGVNALMFFVKQGKREIDVNAVYKKAQEIRKEKIINK